MQKLNLKRRLMVFRGRKCQKFPIAKFHNGLFSRPSDLAGYTKSTPCGHSSTLQFVHSATDGPPGGPGLVFPAGDLPGLVNDDARGLGRRFPHLRIGGQFLRRVAGDIAQEE